MRRLTSEQWVALVGQVGIGGVALLGMFYLFVRVVVPMVAAKVVDLVKAITDATGEVKQLRIDLTAASNKTTDAVRDLQADLGSRISRLEGIYDHHVTNLEPLGMGSRDQGHPSRSR